MTFWFKITIIFKERHKHRLAPSSLYACLTKNDDSLHFHKEFLNFSFCFRKLVVALNMKNEIQPHRKFQNIVQCRFKYYEQRNQPTLFITIIVRDDDHEFLERL